MKQKTFNVEGMTCNSCEKIIAKNVIKLEGIKRIKVDYAAEKVEVDYDSEKISLSKIKETIEKKGYSCNKEKRKKNSWLYWTFAGTGLLIFIYFAWTLYGSINLPTISQNMGYGLLFVVGLLTGFHCVGMCGGFVVSYTAKGAEEGKKPAKLHLSYAIGKTLSYTIIGAVFGLLGSIIAFTPHMRGVAGILAGLFLIIFGLKMLNIIPGLRKFQLKMPNFINRFIGRESREHSNNPLVIGLLNGLMIACGPLQAIYIMAAGTGSMFEGAKMLLIFGLGTLPVMLGFGYLTSIVSKKATHKILKASGAVVILLGLIMVNRGLALTGSGYDLNSLTSELDVLAGANSSAPQVISIKEGYQEIRMDVTRSGWVPNKFVLQKGVPVKWIINGKELNGCNNAIQVPEYGLDFNIKQGEQVIEFTPTKSGKVSWSCWMGMIPGVFVVEDNPGQEDLNDVVVPQGSTCGIPSGKGCGCGGGCGCGSRV